MFTLLLVLHAIVAVLLILVVLIQPGREDGSVAFGGGTSSAFGTETVSVLTKTTAILGAIFMLNSLLLSIAGSKLVHNKSQVERILQHKK